MKMKTNATLMATPPKALSLSNSMVLEDVLLATIKEPARQPKPPSKRAIATAKAILQQFGWVLPILVTDDGIAMAGFEFLIAARELGLTSVKVVRLSSLTSEDRRVLTIAFARLPELSTVDEEALRLEIEDLSKQNLGYELPDVIGYNMSELDIVLDPQDESERPNPLVPEAPSPENTVTQPGDIWRLGRHRAICGSALERETYAKLMAENIARQVLTDPPYNIPIANNVSGLGKVKHGDFAMAVGEMTFTQFSAFLKTVLAYIVAHLMDGGLLYVFMDRRHLEELLSAARELGLTLSDLCFWNKLTGGMGSNYRSQHEPCLIFKYGTAPSLNNIELGKHGRYRTNVWDHRGLLSFGKGRDEALKAHPTVKPVNLLAEAIKDCTKRGDIVLDPFLGSGSTIIAAEKTGRVGYGIEPEPKYVDVTIKRWEKMTGNQAVHEMTGLTFAQLRAQRQQAAHATYPDAAKMTASQPTPTAEMPSQN